MSAKQLFHLTILLMCMADVGHAAPATQVQSVTYDSETITITVE